MNWCSIHATGSLTCIPGRSCDTSMEISPACGVTASGAGGMSCSFVRNKRAGARGSRHYRAVWPAIASRVVLYGGKRAAAPALSGWRPAVLALTG